MTLDIFALCSVLFDLSTWEGVESQSWVQIIARMFCF